MTPEHGTHKKISHGEAIYRRRLLAEMRQKSVFNVDDRITDRVQAERRLAEINQMLTPDDTTISAMDYRQQQQTRLGLEVEHIWLEFKLGIITQAEKQSKLAVKFDEAYLDNEEVYNWLTAKNDHGVSMAEKIRDKVIPPARVAGFYTKR